MKTITFKVWNKEKTESVSVTIDAEDFKKIKPHRWSLRYPGKSKVGIIQTTTAKIDGSVKISTIGQVVMGTRKQRVQRIYHKGYNFCKMNLKLGGAKEKQKENFHMVAVSRINNAKEMLIKKNGDIKVIF